MSPLWYSGSLQQSCCVFHEGVSAIMEVRPNYEFIQAPERHTRPRAPLRVSVYRLRRQAGMPTGSCVCFGGCGSRKVRLASTAIYFMSKLLMLTLQAPGGQRESPTCTTLQEEWNTTNHTTQPAKLGTAASIVRSHSRRCTMLVCVRCCCIFFVQILFLFDPCETKRCLLSCTRTAVGTMWRHACT